ncbi:glycosyltransferase, partial [[Eubacterium] cellulosolvens]
MNSRKRRVVMVLAHDVLYPTIDPRVYKEAYSLVNAGYSVTIVCRMDKPDKPYSEESEGIKIARVLCPHPPLNTSRIIRLRHNRKNLRKVAKKIIELNPEIIHCHDLNTLMEGVRATKKLKVPLVYDSHEDWPLLEFAKSGSKVVYLIAGGYEKRLLKHVTHRIVASPGQSRLLTPRNSLVLMNCPAKDFMVGGDPKPIEKKYKLNGKTVITYHGVVGERKGILELIAVAEKLTKKHHNL